MLHSLVVFSARLWSIFYFVSSLLYQLISICGGEDEKK